jgi:steroid delta-isomerase-like uncharacterized protein
MSDDARLLVRRYYDALNRRDAGALDGLLAPALVHHSVPGRGRQAFKAMLTGFHEGFPDLAHTLEDIVADGDRVAVRTTSTGTHRGTFLGHAPTGRAFRAAALSVYHVEDGAIHEVWEVFDTLDMLRQLGLYTPAPQPPPERDAPAPPARTPHRRAPGPRDGISLAEIRSDPLRFLAAMTREYGAYVRYVCEGRETVLLNEPGAIRHVLHDRAANYSKRNTPDMLLLEPMLGQGLLTTDGPVWRRDRREIQPVLARRQVELSGDVMAGVIAEMLARWRARPDPGAPLDVARELSRLTLEIAARVLLSADFVSRSHEFGEAMDVLNESMSHAHPGNADVQRAFQPALDFIRRTVWQTVLARRFHDTGEDDLLATLLRLQREHGDDDAHVVDQAVTILLAGHETTAKTLSWALALLDRTPSARARLLRELDAHLGDRAPSFDDLPSLPYAAAVIDETLRLDPPIWLLTRSVLEDDEIGGYTIPAGSLVAISPYLVQRRPDLWNEPERFAPERFLEASPSAYTYRYLPFGHGPRHCVGKSFAMLEMPLVLATVCAQFAPALVPGHVVEPEALVTLRPRGGLPMILTERSPLSCA